MKKPLHLNDVPTIAQLRTHSLTAVVQNEIERMILSGELPSGTRLNENALATKLSVSRGPIREACRALAELGFVKRIPNRGVFVSSLERADAEEVYDLRAGLTGLAGFLLAPAVTDHLVHQLRRLLDHMDQAAQDADFEAFYPLNLEFHDVIVESTGNTRLVTLYRRLVKEFHLFRKHGLVQKAALIDSNAEHRSIVQALENRDGQGAYEASFEHVANGKRRMLAALDDLVSSGLTDPANAVARGADKAPRQATLRDRNGDGSIDHW